MDALLKPGGILDSAKKRTDIYEPMINLNSQLLETWETLLLSDQLPV